MTEESNSITNIWNKFTESDWGKEVTKVIFPNAKEHQHFSLFYRLLHLGVQLQNSETIMHVC